MSLPTRTVLGRRCAEFVLGGAQLGLPYGITNRSGAPDLARVQAMLFAAADVGVTTLDTAAAYGESEELIGSALASSELLRSHLWPITKLDLTTNGHALSHAELRRSVERSIDASLKRLRRSSLPLVLLHRPEHRTMASGTVWDSLLRFQDEGVVEHLGVSVYEPADALAAVADPHVDALQAQMNALDRRHIEARVPEAAVEAGTALFIRSVFLQGLLIDPAAAEPAIGPPLVRYLNRHRKLAAEFGRTPRSLALAFARAVPGISGFVLGAETSDQIRENASLWSEPILTPEELVRAQVAIGHVPERLTNASNWRVP